MLINAIKICIKYLFIILISTVVYCLLSRVSLFSNLMTVYYYRSIVLLIISCTAIFVVFQLCRRRLLKLSLKDLTLATMFSFLLNLSFLSLVTVSFDRSISVFLISYMASHPDKSFSKDEIQSIFLEGYMDEYKAMERRIYEQLTTGNFKIASEGRYQITELGINMVDTWRLISKIFPVDNRFLYPNDYLNVNSQNK